MWKGQYGIGRVFPNWNWSSPINFLKKSDGRRWRRVHNFCSFEILHPPHLPCKNTKIHRSILELRSWVLESSSVDKLEGISQKSTNYDIPGVAVSFRGHITMQILDIDLFDDQMLVKEWAEPAERNLMLIPSTLSLLSCKFMITNFNLWGASMGSI